MSSPINNTKTRMPDSNKILSTADKTFNKSLWLFELSVVNSKGWAWIHLPLIYTSRFKIQQEFYASACLSFVSDFDLISELNIELIDGVVIKFWNESLYVLKTEILKNITDSHWCEKRILKNIQSIRNKLPALCMHLEQKYIQNLAIEIEELNKFISWIELSIAISFYNPFAELSYLSCIGRDEEQKILTPFIERYVEPPYYSHMSHFHSHYDRLRKKKDSLTNNDIIKFCWETGFLAKSSNDGSIYEDPEYVSNMLGYNLKLVGGFKQNILSIYNNTQLIDLDSTGIAYDFKGKLNVIEHCFHLLRHLGVHEEFRHYWQGRSMRLIRLLFPQDLDPSEASKELLKEIVL